MIDKDKINELDRAISSVVRYGNYPVQERCYKNVI